MKMRRRWASTVLVVLIPAGVQAQDRGRGPVILDLPASTTALAMGDAFQLSQTRGRPVALIFGSYT